jgi:hypothetical protein
MRKNGTFSNICKSINLFFANFYQTQCAGLKHYSNLMYFIQYSTHSRTDKLATRGRFLTNCCLCIEGIKSMRGRFSVTAQAVKQSCNKQLIEPIPSKLADNETIRPKDRSVWRSDNYMADSLAGSLQRGRQGEQADDQTITRTSSQAISQTSSNFDMISGRAL